MRREVQSRDDLDQHARRTNTTGAHVHRGTVMRPSTLADAASRALGADVLGSEVRLAVRLCDSRLG